jgi:O-antigen/teichoic acid export membrane protein
MKVQSQASTFMVGMMLGSRSAGVYSLTTRAYDTVTLFLSQVNAALVPSMSHLAGSGEHIRFKAVVVRIGTLIPLLAAMGAVAVAVSNQSFVALWVGIEKYGGLPLSLLAAFATWWSFACYVAYDALFAKGEFKAIGRAFAASSLVHVAILALFLHLGLWVAQAAFIVSTLVWGLPLWFRLAASLGLRAAELRTLLAATISTVAWGSATAGALLLLPMAGPGWGGLCVRAALSVAVVFGLVMITSEATRSIVVEEARTTLHLLSKAFRPQAVKGRDS